MSTQTQPAPNATATPRTDTKCKDYFTKSAIGTVMQFIPADFARGLERELNAAKRQANDEFDAVITRNMELEKQLTAAKAEIIRLYADRSAANVGIDAIAGERDQLKARAERAEAQLALAKDDATHQVSVIAKQDVEIATLRAQLRERTQWQCKCGGTDCAGQAENERLRAEVERLNGVKNQLERTGFQTVTQLADAWLNHQNTFKSQTAYVAEVEARETQLRARVADLENDLEKSKHDADDWHRAWETVTEQAMKEVAELEQALAASATKAAAEYGEQLKPLFAKVRELEADKARLDWAINHPCDFEAIISAIRWTAHLDVNNAMWRAAIDAGRDRKGAK